MAITEQSSDAAARLMANEQVLARQLTARQLTMIAIGGAIGTGLFMGSGLSVRVAGPGIIVTYLIGAVVALLLMGALSARLCTKMSGEKDTAPIRCKMEVATPPSYTCLDFRQKMILENSGGRTFQSQPPSGTLGLCRIQ
jgi:hypothetical protein